MKNSSSDNDINPAAAGPQVSEPAVWEDKKRLHPTKWTVVVLAAVLLVVAASALYLFRDKQEPAVIKIDIERVEELSHGLEEKGRYKQAIAAYDGLVAQSEGVDKSTYLSTQALIAQRAKNNDLALDYAIEADKAHSTTETASLVGAIALQLGDKKLAIEYYEKSLEGYKSQKVRDETEEQAIQQIIEDLRAAE